MEKKEGVVLGKEVVKGRIPGVPGKFKVRP